MIIPSQEKIKFSIMIKILHRVLKKSMIKQVINQDIPITDKACCYRTWVLESKVKQLPLSNATISQYQ